VKKSILFEPEWGNGQREFIDFSLVNRFLARFLNSLDFFVSFLDQARQTARAVLARHEPSERPPRPKGMEEQKFLNELHQTLPGSYEQNHHG